LWLKFHHFVDDYHSMVHRQLTLQIIRSLSDTPVVFIQGARQVGKSTLAKALAERKPQARYLTLDDAVALAAAEADPQGFVAGLEGPVVIDEVQRAPRLALAIKAAVDADRTPGRFLLTGSASVLVAPRLSEALAGRVEIHTLWPLSQGELAGLDEHFIDALFGPKFTIRPVLAEGWPAIVHRLAMGGYPEMLRRTTADRRSAWFGSYISTILQRDVRDLADIRDLSELPRLLALVASRAASLLDYADLARGLSMPQTTLKRYLGLLEATMLVHTLPAWFTNIGKRLAKSPKLLLNDTALLLHLIGADAQRLRHDPTLGGGVLENFVALELLKQRGWSRLRPSLFHFRTHHGDEVDLVLEDPAGRIVGIEVKASATIDAGHFRGLRVLSEAAGKRFVRGVVLYTGSEAAAFGKDLLALPLPTLWNTPGAE
jgi:hypothetical protein